MVTDSSREHCAPGSEGSDSRTEVLAGHIWRLCTHGQRERPAQLGHCLVHWESPGMILVSFIFLTVTHRQVGKAGAPWGAWPLGLFFNSSPVLFCFSSSLPFFFFNTPHLPWGLSSQNPGFLHPPFQALTWAWFAREIDSMGATGRYLCGAKSVISAWAANFWIVIFLNYGLWKLISHRELHSHAIVSWVCQGGMKSKYEAWRLL